MVEPACCFSFSNGMTDVVILLFVIACFKSKQHVSDYSAPNMHLDPGQRSACLILVRRRKLFGHGRMSRLLERWLSPDNSH